jgi:hypothetical protein
MPRNEYRKYPANSYGGRKRVMDRHAQRMIGDRSVPPFQKRLFAAVDGEGGNIWGPNPEGSPQAGHHYFLLRAGDRELFHADKSPLHSWEILHFLATLDPSFIYIAFFFDYDVTMITRDLPEERRKRLIERDKRFSQKSGQYLPVDVYNDLQIDYLHTKEFKVRRVLQRPDFVKGIPGRYSHWVTISDTGSFFQCSFVRALKQWFGTTDKNGDWTPESEWYGRVVAQISEGKDLRSEFGGIDDYVREYCRLECAMLEELMTRFRDICYNVSLRPSKWQGPGNIVTAVLKGNGFPRNNDIHMWDTPTGKVVLGYGLSAYYGGRFEATRIGAIDGPVYQYDICSAYPSVYQNLPCLLHGRWVPVRYRDSAELLRTDDLWIGRIGFEHKSNVYLCGLPVRSDSGTIVFPRNGNGFYWSHEIKAALPYLKDWHLFNGYRYVSECDCRHFDFVPHYYDERNRLGKNDAGYPLKLFLNSLYGKFCQSVGIAPYANPIYASLITSMVRAQLYTAAVESDYGLGTVMLATDGIFTTHEKDNLPLGSALGDWERTVHDSMFVVQSGLYFLPGKMPKTRGTPAARIQAVENEFREKWAEFINDAEHGDTIEYNTECDTRVSVVNFISTALGLARNNPEIIGQWVPDDKNISFDWGTKRQPVGMAYYSSVLTVPYLGDIDNLNHSYQKPIGGILRRLQTNEAELERFENETQPDWNFGGII